MGVTKEDIMAKLDELEALARERLKEWGTGLTWNERSVIESLRLDITKTQNNLLKLG